VSSVQRIRDLDSERQEQLGLQRATRYSLL